MKFNLFRSGEASTRPVFIDKTFITIHAKMKACCKDALQDPRILFITWFPDTTSKLTNFFLKENIPGDRIIEYKFVHHAKLTGHTAVFAEHYPLHAKEESLVENWEQKKIIVYSGLDEPLFIQYGGENLIGLVKRMGLDEDEAIEHPLISRSILNIQEKNAKKVITDQFASSQEEWFSKNLK